MAFGYSTCRAQHELQDNSISQQVVRQARQIIPKKAEAHVAMEIIGCEKQAARFCWCLGWIWDSLDSLDSFNLVNSELNQTGPECHEVRLRAIHGVRHRRDSQTDHLSSQRPGENGDQGPKVGSFPFATGNWDEKSRFTTYCNQTYSASPSWIRFRYWFQTLRNLHLRQCFQVLNDRVLFEYSWNRSAGTLHCKIWALHILRSPYHLWGRRSLWSGGNHHWWLCTQGWQSLDEATGTVRTPRMALVTFEKPLHFVSCNLHL